MIAEIDFREAQARTWDVIVAGTSFSAMFFARGLPRGLNVLFVEKGVVESHADQLAGHLSPTETISMDNQSGKPKQWIANSRFGGNSNCWWGQTPRMHPNDFRLRTAYGVGEDWPFSYEELEPFYTQVEALMEVSGGGTDGFLPRSAPFPFPPHTLSRADQVSFAARPDIWFACPTARSTGGRRPVCCANGVCSLCPIEAKFTILNSVDQFEDTGMALLTGAEVRAVDIQAGQARGVVVRMRDGAQARIAGGVVALGANAIFNAAILLRSGLTSPALGRYLHEQASATIDIDIDAPNYFGGTSITAHCYAFYDGPHRRDAGAVLIENYNAPASLRHEPGKWTNRMRVRLIADDLPQAENLVQLGEGDEPHVIWTGHSDYAHAGIARAEAGLADIFPFAVERIVERVEPETEAHIQGTHRMGRDAATSVTNDLLRCHEVGGLYALGAGAYPSCSPVNPTLTLSALALRAGQSL